MTQNRGTIMTWVYYGICINSTGRMLRCFP